ncbi:MAG: VWA domain-containing protein [Planctomycetes bacterium]|nr:VWA domain-containing protein [Planctomycetota bacterium]
MARRLLRAALRLAIVALLIAAIADLPVPLGSARRSRVYIIDASGSVDSASTRDALRAFQQDRKRFAPSDHAAFIATGARPIPFTDSLPEVGRDRTDLGAAIEAAVALAGEHGDVILATDGRDTEGSLDRALLAAAARSVPVHVLPAGPVNEIDARIAAIDVPAVVPPDSRFDARVTLESNGPARGTLNGIPFEFAGAARQVIVLRDLPSVSRLPLTLDIADACDENNAAEALLVVRTSAPRVRTPAHIAPAFPRDWTVETEGRPEAFDAVVIDRLDREAAAAARDRGVGLIVLGGSRSYALGGFAGTPLEDVLPLWAFPEERCTIVFALDRSGSMAGEVPELGRRKIDVASTAIASALDLVHPDDLWGLVAFSGSAETMVALRRGTAALPSIAPGGSTLLIPALSHALETAEMGPSGRKRIVLVTDGDTEETDDRLEALGRRLSERGARLTVIATGESTRKLKLLGGALVPASDLARLPQVMEEALARSNDLVLENVSVETSDHPLLKGLPPWPILPRINRASAKKHAAQVLAASGDAPVVAVGLGERGRVAAATFAFEEGWAADWPGFAQILTRLVEHVSPPAAGITSASARVEDGDIVFSVRCPGRSDHSIRADPAPLRRRGEDLYEGRVRAEPGTTFLRVDGRVLAACTIPHAPEYAALGPDPAALDRIARLTGGRILSGLQDLAVLPARRAPGTRPGRPIFLPVALALFLIEAAAAVFWRTGGRR